MRNCTDATRGRAADDQFMPSPTASVSFGHVSMFTADLDRFRRFYEDVLGMRTVAIDHADQQPFRRSAELTDAACEATRLVVREVPGYTSGLPDDVTGRRGRLDELTFHMSDGEEFERAVRRLVEHGASSGEISSFGPVRSVLFVDPDGGHHHLETPRRNWAPSRSIEIVDDHLWHRVHPDLQPPAHRTPAPNEV